MKTSFNETRHILRSLSFRRAIVLTAALLALAEGANAQTLYWDGNATAGFQAADGDFTSSYWNASTTGTGALVAWTNNGTGTATFNGNNTSSVTLNSAGNGTNFYIQNSAANGSTTTINISGTSSLTLSNAIGVGWSTSGVASTGAAILNQSGGTISATGAMTVGRFGTNGTYTLTGGNLSASSLNIANGLLNASSTVAPVGVVNISGGTMTLSAGSNAINVGNGGLLGYVANGTLNMNSGLLTASGPLNISGADYSNGVVNLIGGTLTVQQVTTKGIGSSSLIRFNGGTLKASSNALSGFMQGLTNAYVDNGGALIDINGRTINIGQDLLQGTGTGGLTVSSTGGGGNLTLNGNNTFSGATVISGGILIVGNNTRALQNSALDTTNSVTGTATAGLRTTGANLTLGGLSGNKDLSSIYTTTSGGYSSVTSLTLNPGTGATNTYNGVISNGASGMTLTKTGAGTQILSAANTYSGVTSVQAGTLGFTSGNTSATAAQSLGTNSTVSLGVAATSSGTLDYTGTGAATLAKNINALGNGNDTIRNSSSSLLTLTGALSTNGTSLTLRGGTGGLSVNGTISGALSGSNVIAHGGVINLNAANSYNGSTTVRGGATLNVNNASALNSTTALTVEPSSTLAINVSNSVSNTAAVTLAGGTISRSSGVSETFGTLTLTSASSLDFGTGTAGTFNFGAYTGNSYKLNVLNFGVGNVLTFKTNLTGSITNPSLFAFSGGFTSSWNNSTSTFTITAVPEPTAIGAAVLFLGLVGFRARKNLWREVSSSRKA